MLEWHIAVLKKCQEINEKAATALSAQERGQSETVKALQRYMLDDFQALRTIWHQVDPGESRSDRLNKVGSHIYYGDLLELVQTDIPALLKSASKIAVSSDGAKPPEAVGFEELLHPEIVTSSLAQYRSGQLRDAVLNSVIAVFDMIRRKTGLTQDGKDLTGQAFGLDRGKLVFSDIESESGKNDQKGFMMIYEGVYTGVRNVKAHTLEHDLDEKKAAQYLVMLSLLASRVDECKLRDEIV